jgi:dimethylaniline monooxygenase (N-oxide forming)
MLQASKTATSVTWSNHVKQKLNLTLPRNVNEKPDIARLTPNGAIFVNDNVEHEFTVILYCTGYQHSFPFISVDCEITVDENFISPLYKHCLNINRPSIGFIGLPTAVCNNQVFDFQARFCLKFMTQQLKLPPRDVMLRDFESDMEARWKRGLTRRRAHFMGFDIQEKYFEELATIAELEPVKPVILKIFNKSILNLFSNLNNFRSRKFKVIDDETFEEME